MSWLNVVSFVGIFILCGVAWLGSESRKTMPWKVILWGIALQLALGLLVFRVPVTREILRILSTNINAILDATEAGARFVFGDLLVPNPAFAPGPVGAGRWLSRALTPAYIPVSGDRLTPENLNVGYILAFRALPSVVFFSALMALLYNLKLIQPVVQVFAKVFYKLMGLSGAESLSGAANIFVGIESALVVRPFLAEMTRSELCAVLTACYGSIASTVLALYANLLRPTFPNIVGHLVSASLMAIPACFVVSKILVPETSIAKTAGGLPEDLTEDGMNPMESVITGAWDGVRLAVSIASLLIAVLGLVALVNLFFGNLAALGQSTNPNLVQIGNVFRVITVQNILGALCLPIVAVTGVSDKWPELWQSSVLIGRRLLETEVPAYLELAKLSQQGVIGDRALVIVSYILCGFAHIPAVGIFVGGFVSLIPTRRKDLTELGWKALWAASLATAMIGCVAGVFFSGDAAIVGR